jgi:hypothetical protein
MTNRLNRIRLLNHRANRLKRPERIWEALLVRTGERIKVRWWKLASNYSMLLNADTSEAIMPEQYPIMFLDNHEEGD